MNFRVFGDPSAPKTFSDFIWNRFLGSKPLLREHLEYYCRDENRAKKGYFAHIHDELNE